MAKAQAARKSTTTARKATVTARKSTRSPRKWSAKVTETSDVGGVPSETKSRRADDRSRRPSHDYLLLPEDEHNARRADEREDTKQSSAPAVERRRKRRNWIVAGIASLMVLMAAIGSVIAGERRCAGSIRPTTPTPRPTGWSSRRKVAG